MSRRSYKGSSQATMLSAPLNSSDLAATVADGSTLPTGSSAPFVLTLDLGLAGEEKVLVASRTGNNLVLVSRGYDGTTATSHSSGANVRHTISAIDLDEANAHVNSTTSVHGIADTAALLTTAAANAAYKAIGTKTTTRIAHTFTISGAVVVASGDTAYIPPFFVPVPTGQTVTLAGIYGRANAGTVAVRIDRNGSGIYGPGNFDQTARTPGSPVFAPVTLAANDMIACVVTTATFDAKNLSVTLYLDYTA